ncbi:MAG: hypothetical protein ACT4PZ_15235 [Panacagrimonas sp.]
MPSKKASKFVILSGRFHAASSRVERQHSANSVEKLLLISELGLRR